MCGLSQIYLFERVTDHRFSSTRNRSIAGTHTHAGLDKGCHLLSLQSVRFSQVCHCFPFRKWIGFLPRKSCPVLYTVGRIPYRRANRRASWTSSENRQNQRTFFVFRIRGDMSNVHKPTIICARTCGLCEDHSSAVRPKAEVLHDGSVSVIHASRQIHVPCAKGTTASWIPIKWAKWQANKLLRSPSLRQTTRKVSCTTSKSECAHYLCRMIHFHPFIRDGIQHGKSCCRCYRSIPCNDWPNS